MGLSSPCLGTFHYEVKVKAKYRPKKHKIHFGPDSVLGPWVVNLYPSKNYRKSEDRYFIFYFF